MGAKRELRIFVGTAGTEPLYTLPSGNTAPSSVSPALDSGVFVTPRELRLDGARGDQSEGLAEPAKPTTARVPSIPVASRDPDDGMFHAPCSRPLHVGEESRIAPPVVCGGWTKGPEIEAPLVAGLDDDTRRALGEAWLHDALEEHAAVAAFADVVMALLSMGAPAELLGRVQQASLQEVEHARLCFSLASAYLGVELGPGPLAVGPLVPLDPRALALASWRDGCLGEGIGAAIARAARRRAHDPAVCAALTVISRDEGAHAELAWDILGFCLSRGGLAVAEALREAVGRTRAPEIVDDLPGFVLTALLAEHGRISPADRARCAADATRTAVRRAGWLLAPSGAPRAAPIV